MPTKWAFFYRDLASHCSNLSMAKLFPKKVEKENLRILEIYLRFLKISEKRKITRKRVRLRKLEKNVEQEQQENTKMSRLKMLKNNNKKKIQRCKSSSSLTSHRSHLKSRDLNLDRCSALKEVLLRLFEFKRVRAFSQFFKKLMTLYNCNLNRHPR